MRRNIQLFENKLTEIIEKVYLLLYTGDFKFDPHDPTASSIGSREVSEKRRMLLETALPTQPTR